MQKQSGLQNASKIHLQKANFHQIKVNTLN